MRNEDKRAYETMSKETMKELENIAHGIQCAAIACTFLGANLPVLGASDGSDYAVIECIGGYLEYLSLRANKISGIDP